MPTLKLVAAAETPPDAPQAASASDTFHAVLAVENTPTGDNRFFETGAFTWRELPLPMMADDENNPMHLNSKLIGNITSIMRVGDEIHADGVYVQPADPASEDGQRVLHLQGLMRDGSLKGVSVDLDDIDLDLIIPGMSEDELAAEFDPTEDMVVPINSETMPREVYHGARIMGATALPFPALQEAHVEPDAVAAAALLSDVLGITGWVSDGALTASVGIAPPVTPPAAWFERPKFDGPTALTVTDEGRVFGHIAGWDTCHIGFGDKCVTPPRSACSYANYALGEVLCDDGSRVVTGKLTAGTGHAPLAANASQAIAHYDNTGYAAADVAIGEDEFGIWVSGAVRPDATPAQIRTLMASQPSGDWRAVRGNLECVAVLMVNTPGFPVPRLRVRESQGMVASLVASLPLVPRRTPPARTKTVASPRMKELLAASIGRDRATRLAAVKERMGR